MLPVDIPVFHAKPVVFCHNKLGEGIVWDDLRGELCWIDIRDPKFWRYNPITHEVFEQDLPERPGALALCNPDKVSPDTYVIALEGGPAFYNLTTRTLKRIFEFEPFIDTRLNDSRVDYQGRFVIGGLCYGKKPISNVYRINTDLSIETLIEGVACSNSTCWSLDGKTMFYTDSRTNPRVIYQYDYDDRVNTPLKNRRVFVEWSLEETGRELELPDGSIVDADGYLWNVEHGKGRVVRYDSEGNVVMMVKLPEGETNCTCCAFGGTNLDTMYITTKWKDLGGDAEFDLTKGALYEVKIPGVRGVRENRFEGTEYGLRRKSKL